MGATEVDGYPSTKHKAKVRSGFSVYILGRSSAVPAKDSTTLRHLLYQLA